MSAPTTPPTRRSRKTVGKKARIIGSGAIAAVLALVFGMMALSSVNAGSASAAPGATAELELDAVATPGTTFNVAVPVDGQTTLRPQDLILNIGGQTFRAYCINLHTEATAGTYTEADWSEKNVPGEANIQWILQHSYPHISASEALRAAGVDPTTLGGTTPAAQEYYAEVAVIGATQAAIWHYSDGITVTGFNNELRGPAAQKLYDWFLANSSAGATAAPVTPTITVGPDVSATNGVVGPITVTTSDGSDASITVSPAATLQYLDGSPVDLQAVKSGVAFQAVGAPGSGSYTITATGSGSVSTGRVFVKDGSQTLVLAGGTAYVTRTTTAVITWDNPVSETSTSTSTSTSTTTVPETTSTSSTSTSTTPTNPCATPTTTGPDGTPTTGTPTDDGCTTPTTTTPTTTSPETTSTTSTTSTTPDTTSTTPTSTSTTSTSTSTTTTPDTTNPCVTPTTTGPDGTPTTGTPTGDDCTTPTTTSTTPTSSTSTTTSTSSTTTPDATNPCVTPTTTGPDGTPTTGTPTGDDCTTPPPCLDTTATGGSVTVTGTPTDCTTPVQPTGTAGTPGGPGTPGAPGNPDNPGPLPQADNGTAPVAPLAQTGVAVSAIAGSALLLLGAGLMFLAMTRRRANGCQYTVQFNRSVMSDSS